ncbi:MAG: DUF4405 domain-containing protein [Alphaproteobacteria bacterium]|nr:DUF4405 domain-containing protein [Alphaproteobacteria bacterium]
MEDKKKSNTHRATVSLVTTWAFVISGVTGLVLFITPQGRVASWVDWELTGLTKDGWVEMHTIFSLLFLVIGVWHLILNWKPFKSYFANRVAEGLRISKALVGSLAVTAVFFALTLYQLPPVSWVFMLSGIVKDGWIASPEYEPPFGHAEELSLAGFSKRQFIDTDAAAEALRAAGFDVPDKRMTLRDIARRNATTPMALYRVIRPLERRPALQARYTPEGVEAEFAGMGLGQKTVTQLAEMLDMHATALQAKLAAAGIRTQPEHKLKALADDHGLKPIDILKIVLVDGYKP